MSDGTKTAAAMEIDPNHPAVKVNRGVFEVYRLGMLHAAYLLRGSDCREASSEAMDACARLIEFDARNRDAIASWPIDPEFKP